MRRGQRSQYASCPLVPGAWWEGREGEGEGQGEGVRLRFLRSGARRRSSTPSHRREGEEEREGPASSGHPGFIL